MAYGWVETAVEMWVARVASEAAASLEEESGRLQDLVDIDTQTGDRNKWSNLCLCAASGMACCSLGEES